MEIRRATIADLANFESIAGTFYSTSRFLKGFQIERFCKTWAPLLENGNGVIFMLAEGTDVLGAIGGIIYPDIYSGTLVAVEFFWFVRDEHRGKGLKLYRLFEGWARERGAEEIRMVHLMDSMPEKLQKVYGHLGFSPIEVHYSKGLVV